MIFERWKRALAYPQTLDFSTMTQKEDQAFSELGAAWERFKATAVVRALVGGQK